MSERSGVFKKIFWFIIRILFAAGIITWLIWSNKSDIQNGFSQISSYWYWLIPAFILYILHMLVCAWRWQKLAQVINIRLTLVESINLTMKGYFFSLVLPGGAIGGDLAKIGFMASRSTKGMKVEGAFSILMDRITGMAALFGIAIIVILLSLPQLMTLEFSGSGLEVTDTLRIIFIVVLLGLCVAGITAMFAIFNHRTLEKIPPVRFIMQWVDGKTRGAVRRMCDATDLYTSSWKTLVWLTIVGIFFVHLNLVAVTYCLMKAIGVEEFSILGLTAAVIIGNIAALIPFTPGGVGIRDLTMKELLVAAGAGGVSATVPILFTSIMIICNLLAGFFFIFDAKGKKEKSLNG